MYQKNSDRCLEIAKKHISKRPDRAEPYYFATLIYKDRFSEANTIKSKYTNLSRSMSYAYRFDKKPVDILKEEVQWEYYKDELSKSALELIYELNREKLNERVVKLEKKYNRLMDKPIEKTKKKETKPIATIKSEFKNGEYFGLATGNEIIESADLEGEIQLLALINEERKAQGMEPLVWDENLAKAARYHACDLATQNYFNHNSHDKINGKLVEVAGTFDRIRKFYTASFANSENIAAGNSEPERTYNQWYNSPGHYKNMFNSSSRKVGIGVFYDKNSRYGYYWVFCTAL